MFPMLFHLNNKDLLNDCQQILDTNKTFLQRIGGKDNDDGFTSLDKIKEAFSLSAVTDIFYKDFFVEYNKLVEAVKKRNKILDHPFFQRQ